MRHRQTLEVLSVLVLLGTAGVPACDGVGLPQTYDINQPKPPPPTPKIDTVIPQRLSSAGGEPLVIRGHDFQRGARVRIGTSQAPEVEWHSDKEIVVRTPTRFSPKEGERFDIAIANPGGMEGLKEGGVSYFPGLIGFRPAVESAAGVAPIAVHVQDLNNDKIPDVIAAYAARGVMTPMGSVTVFFGNQDGSFAFFKDFATERSGLSGMAVGDVTGDRIADVALVNSGSSLLSLFRGLGGGDFAAPKTMGAGATPVAILALKINGDELMDLVTANNDGTDLSLLISKGDGAFSGTRLLLGAPPSALAGGDLDEDGKNDLVVTNLRYNELTTLYGDGNGGFVEGGVFSTGARPEAVALADLDGDQHLDIVVANRGSNTVSIYLGAGKGRDKKSFVSKGAPYAGSSPAALALGDLNRDGRADVLVPCYDSKTVAVLIAGEGGYFRPAVSYSVGGYATAVGIADLDRDGLSDLLAANGNATLSLLLNASR